MAQHIPDYARPGIRNSSSLPVLVVVAVGAAALAVAAVAGYLYHVRNAPLAPSSVQISGSAWATKADGSSDVLRGLRVELVGRTVPSSALASNLNALAKTFRDEAKGFRQDADASRARAKEWESTTPKDVKAILSNPSLDDVKREVEAAAEADRRAKAIELAASSLPAQVDLRDAVAAAKRFHSEAHFTFAAVPKAAGAVQSAVADVNGRYVLQNVLPGSYYVHAQFRTELHLLEWFVPVQVSAGGGDVTVDLYNDNADIVENFDPLTR